MKQDHIAVVGKEYEFTASASQLQLSEIGISKKLIWELIWEMLAFVCMYVYVCTGTY